MQLAPLISMRGINTDPALIAAEARMGVHAPFTFVFGWLRILREVDAAVRFEMIQVRCLQAPHAFRIGVADQPLVLVQVGKMAA